MAFIEIGFCENNFEIFYCVKHLILVLSVCLSIYLYVCLATTFLLTLYMVLVEKEDRKGGEGTVITIFYFGIFISY